MATNPSKDVVRQPDPRTGYGDMSAPQDLMNQSWDPVMRTFVTQVVGSPDGTNMYQQKVNADGSAPTSDLTAQTIAQAVYDALTRLQPYQNALPYARSISDQMRVVVDSGGSLGTYQYWANAGSYASYYAQGGPNSVDAREQLELTSQNNFNSIRQGRWVIT